MTASTAIYSHIPPWPDSSRAPLETVGPDDDFFNFLQWRYSPLTDPLGKPRTSNLLFASFDLFRCDPRYFDLVRDLRERVGPHQTVWGVKKLGDRYVWEFYFYRNA